MKNKILKPTKPHNEILFKKEKKELRLTSVFEFMSLLAVMSKMK